MLFFFYSPIFVPHSSIPGSLFPSSTSLCALSHLTFPSHYFPLLSPQAAVLSDMVVLYVVPRHSYYREQKYHLVSSKDLRSPSTSSENRIMTTSFFDDKKVSIYFVCEADKSDTSSHQEPLIKTDAVI